MGGVRVHGVRVGGVRVGGVRVFSSTVRAQVERNTFKPISIILQEGAVIYMNINNK